MGQEVSDSLTWLVDDVQFITQKTVDDVPQAGLVSIFIQGPVKFVFDRDISIDGILFSTVF